MTAVSLRVNVLQEADDLTCEKPRASLATAIYDLKKQSDCLLSRSQGLVGLEKHSDHVHFDNAHARTRQIPHRNRIAFAKINGSMNDYNPHFFGS